MAKRIVIFDTTLRDGEQSPGASLNTAEKLEIARQLSKLNVDVIETGFPASSSSDFEATKLIAANIKGTTICGLARCVKKDIDLAVEALMPAKKKRVHIFLGTSAIHRKYKLKKSKDEILKITRESVKYASRFADDIEFSPEDASRTELKYLVQVISAAIDAGASVINVPDTVGYATPEEFGDLIANLQKTVTNINKVTVSVHCHNDLGLATASSLSGIQNGAGQIECTINGIGERAGNASLEEIVMLLKTRKNLLKFSTGVKTSELYRTSKLVSNLTGIRVQSNKAIVGDNAFRHEAGIHQDGILKEKTTYEIMKPESIGKKEINLVLGKHSGRHGFSERLSKLGYKLTKKDIDKAFLRFKELADKKKEIYDDDLEAIIEEKVAAVPEIFELVYINTTSGNRTVPTATIRLKHNGKILQDAACGDGPVDAAYKTIDRITGLGAKLIDYSLRAVTSGKDALGEVTVKIGKREHTASGRGTSTDIIEASARAYVMAVNRMLSRTSKTKGRG